MRHISFSGEDIVDEGVGYTSNPTRVKNANSALVNGNNFRVSSSFFIKE